MPHCDYSTHQVHRDNDLVTVAGRRVRVSTLPAGPNSAPGASLIPEATVIDGRMPERTCADYAAGDMIHVAGYGDYKIVDTGNRDWPRLVPQFGPRYYADFQGSGIWRIRDRDNDGNVIHWATCNLAMEMIGLAQITSLAAAQLVASWLSVFAAER